MHVPLHSQVGSLPIAWPYLGKDVYALHWRLSQIYRAMLPSLVAQPAPHLRRSPHSEVRRQLPVGPGAGAAGAAGTAGAAGAAGGAQHGRPRRIRLGVVAESHGNHSPGMLLQGMLERLSKDEFALVFFEIPDLRTPFATAMRAAAAEAIGE